MNKKIDDWRSIFAEQEASGESGRAYCRAKGIAYSTFGCRRGKLKNRQRPLESGNNMPLVRHSLPKGLLAGRWITVQWPDGMTVKIPFVRGLPGHCDAR